MLISPEAEALGREAADRLARLGFVEIRPGLTDEEFARIEERFGFQFADHHGRLLAGLRIVRPTSSPPSVC